LNHSSAIAFRLGKVAEAESYSREAMELGGVATDLVRPTEVAWLIEALIDRGELEEAEHEVAGSHTWNDSLGFIFDFLLESRGWLRVCRGHYDSGLRDLLEFSRREAGLRARNPAASPWRSRAALALARLGDRAEAARLAAEEVSRATAFGAPRAIGIALRAVGLLEGENGVEPLGEAVAVLEPSAARLEYARALGDLGAVLRRAGHRREAQEHLRQALDIAHRCGGEAVAKHAQAELRASGARPRRRVLSGSESLTPSERRIAALAAEGASNREIAETLFLSLKTVEMHLSRAYRKLEIGSRRQLASALQTAS
jgi:DNA-binding CsgD family transcriptional regulator